MYRLLATLLFFSQTVHSASSMISYDWSDYAARTTKQVFSPSQRDIDYTFLTALNVNQDFVPALSFVLTGAQKNQDGRYSPIDICDPSDRDSFRSDDWEIDDVALQMNRTCSTDNETHKTILVASTSHYQNIRYLIDKFQKGTDSIDISFEVGDKYSDTYEKFSVSSTGFTKQWRNLINHLQKDADNDSPIAQLSLGLVYRFGIGVSRDSQKARTLLEKSATKGHTSSQIHLGFMYADGKEIEQDLDLAVSWLGKAAVSGSRYAIERLTSIRALNPDIKPFDCKVQEAIYMAQFKDIEKLAEENNANLTKVRALLKQESTAKQNKQLLSMEIKLVESQKNIDKEIYDLTKKMLNCN